VSRFTRELEADVPQIVAAMHVAGIGEGEVSCSVAHADFFHDNVRAVAGSGEEEPGVKGPQLIAGAVPTDVGVRDELGDLAGDLEAECFPVEGNMALSWPEGSLTTTSVAFEYQPGQASAAVSVAQIFSTGALMTIALCANRSAWTGSKPSGQ
jgi:hypothetical protein